MAATTATTIPESVIVHPLVLLSVVDHYSRVAENTKKRVVGILLGQSNGKSVNVANSYALPFEEDDKDANIWFLDHNYLESMWDMSKKINASERIIGWYHTGPKLRSSDIEINELIKRYTPNPVLVVIDVDPTAVGLPTSAYMAVEEIHQDGTAATSKTLNHIHSEIQAEESEEIGVEHLLRDVKDNAVGSLSTRVSTTLHSLQGLHVRLVEIQEYLQQVIAGALPVNHGILYNLQDVFNLLPNLMNPHFLEAYTTTSHDRLMVVYVCSLIRSVLALHQLIDNKIENRDFEVKANADAVESKEEKPVTVTVGK